KALFVHITNAGYAHKAKAMMDFRLCRGTLNGLFAPVMDVLPDCPMCDVRCHGSRPACRLSTAGSPTDLPCFSVCFAVPPPLRALSLQLNGFFECISVPVCLRIQLFRAGAPVAFRT
ncbi:MAG: hypothetical protein SOW23_11000, partial [Eubacteriales bacterium]|nr:hypothetical protein [Eubacteriales bacterium]